MTAEKKQRTDNREESSLLEILLENITLDAETDKVDLRRNLSAFIGPKQVDWYLVARGLWYLDKSNLFEMQKAIEGFRKLGMLVPDKRYIGTAYLVYVNTWPEISSCIYDPGYLREDLLFSDETDAEAFKAGYNKVVKEYNESIIRSKPLARSVEVIIRKPKEKEGAAPENCLGADWINAQRIHKKPIILPIKA